MKSLRLLFSLCVGCGFFLSSCGSDSTDISGTASFNVNDVSPKARAIFEAFPNSITYRVVTNYELLDTAVLVQPVSAAPTFFVTTEENGNRFTALWHKASNAGTNPWRGGYGNGAGTIRAEQIPLDKRDFSLAIEYILPFQDEDGGLDYHVVAYGCFFNRVDPSARVSEDDLRSGLKNPGITIYAGRTCGTCPPVENGGIEGDFEDFDVTQTGTDASGNPVFQFDEVEDPEDPALTRQAPRVVCADVVN